MLTPEENATVTRVGPGTPMGEVFRRYWLPALLSSDLVADDDPRPLRLLGEDLVAFRDTDGRVGVLDERCCHRQASLLLARNEACGLRCIYHGWKFDVEGAVVDAPNVKGGLRRMTARAYRVREAAGLIWVYLGAEDQEPPFPAFNFMNVDEPNRVVLRNDLDCNWLQIMEGGLDASHVGVLHDDQDPLSAGRERASYDNSPTIVVENTAFGYHYAAIRELEQPEGEDPLRWIRVQTFAVPNVTMVSGGATASFTFFYVPYDDEHTGYFMCRWDDRAPVDVDSIRDWTGFHAPGYFSGDHFDGDRSNRWLQDRAAMRAGDGAEVTSFSGYHGRVSVEDYAVDLSMGPILDRSRERLVPADLAVIRARKLLLEAARQVQEGREPASLRVDTSQIHVADAVVPADTPWQSLVAGNLAAGHEVSSADVEVPGGAGAAG